MEKYAVTDVNKRPKRKHVSYKTLTIVVIVVVLLCAAICSAIVVPMFNTKNASTDQLTHTTPKVTTSPEPVRTEVETECGRVQGLMEEGLHVFKGIPYAEPPIGNLRWKPPVLKSPESNNCWNDTLKATDFGNVCFQNFGSLTGSEDCLYLNVFTPKVDNSSLLPVMVYIHGGSLQYLSGNKPGAAKLAADTQVVYVSFNYRLSVFGFLALDELTSQSTTNSSGNYGFMDQQMALRWVQRNIRQFGGNPSLVTIFGESSGGTSVMVLLASPLSRGLFHRAWGMSSSVVMNKTLAEVSQDNLQFFNNSGCSDIRCLYSLNSEQVLSAVPLHEWPRWDQTDAFNIPTKGLFSGAIAIIDGYVLHEDPLEAFRAGRGMKVPVFISTLAQETSMMEAAPGVRSWVWENYTSYVREKLTPFGEDIADRALELYPPSDDITPEQQLTTLSTDIRTTCPNEVLSNALAASSEVRVYRLVMTSRPAIPVTIFGLPYKPAYAFHAWDDIVLFSKLDELFKKPSPENVAFKQILEQEMIYFARYGYPYTVQWEAYPNVTAVISSKVDIEADYHKDKCGFWLSNGFFSYGWVN